MLIQGVEVYPGRPCPHSTGQGCDDYANRPLDPCHNFNCGWIIEGSPLPEWMKPDSAGVIVLFNQLVWNGLPVDLAVPVGRRVPPRALHWLQEFSRTQGRPLVYTEQVLEGGQFQKEQQVYGYGPPEFQQHLLRRQQEGKRLW
jgi:hypothetical protein